MADYQRIVEFLRDFRNTPAPVIDETLRQYARDYAELCTQANDRLRQCSGFLQKGLRSEAIHLAEEEPNLLELVAALDLPDPSTWSELCRANDLPVPPILQMDRATQLNDAYSSDQPIEHLLRRHRYLALARAPLVKRLDILRRLSTQDPGNPFWREDQALMETRRLPQLRNALHDALSFHDRAAIKALHQELERPDWVSSVPEDLRKEAREAYQKLIQTQIEDELRRDVEALQDAFAQGHRERCEEILALWDQKTAAAGLNALSTSLMIEVTPILAWIKQLNQQEARNKRFQIACERIRELLASNPALSALEAAIEQLHQYPEPVPADLAEALDRLRLEQQSSIARKRKIRLVLIGTTAGILVTGSVGGLWMARQAQSTQQWSQRIHQAVVSRKLAEAQELLRNLHSRAPDVEKEKELVRVRGEVEQLSQDFEKDTRTLKETLADATQINQKADTTLQQTGLGPIELSTTAGELDRHLQRLAKPESLSWVDRDQQLAPLLQRMESLRDQARQMALNDILRQIQAVEVPATKGAMRSEALQTLILQIGRLRSLVELPVLDANTKERLTASLATLEQRRGKFEEALLQQQDFFSQMRTVGSSENLGQVISNFLTRYPKSPMKADLTEVQSLLPAAKAYESWCDLTRTWRDQPIPSSFTTAKRRAEAIGAYLTATPGSMLQTLAQTYQTYLSQAAEALDDKGVWQGAFEELLSNPMFTELSYMEVSDGVRYFVLGNIKRKESRLNDNISILFETLDPSNLTKRKIVSIDPPRRLVTAKPVLTAHARLVKSVGDQVRLVTEKNWDTWGIDQIDRILKTPNIEPAVKALLIQQILKITQQLNGWALGELYLPTIRTLTRLDPAKIVWYDPEHPVSEETAEGLKKVFADIPPADTARELLASKKAKLCKEVVEGYTATGCLIRDENERWSLSIRGPMADGDPAVALVKEGGDATSFRLIGRVKGGEVQLQTDALQKLPQGTPVYVGTIRGIKP